MTTKIQDVRIRWMKVMGPSKSFIWSLEWGLFLDAIDPESNFLLLVRELRHVTFLLMVWL